MEAFDQTARPEVIIAFFKCVGIWPVNRHPVLQALEQLEDDVGRARVSLFQIRQAEGYDVEDDALFTAWKALQLRKKDMEEAIGESSFSKSTPNENLCPVIENVLKYPDIATKEKKVRQIGTSKAHDI